MDQSGKCVSTLKNVSNCAEYQGLKCIGCELGFRLLNDQCSDEKNLQIKIRKTCAPGYYLGSDYRCKVASGNLVKDDGEDEKNTVSIR